MSTPSTHPNCASDERGYQRIRFRQDTAENWLKNDPILASGEMGYVIGATDGPNLKVGDGWVKWSQLPWISSGDGTAGTPGPQGPAGPEGPPGHDALHIVSEVEPPPGQEIGDLWIDPTADIEAANIDVLAAIRGKVIAPKAIDLDGPNTLFITANPDGTAKLSLRVDGTPLKGIVEESIATEEWVLANSGNIYVGTTAPGNLSTLWLNPAGGGIAPTVEPPFVVSDLAPTTTSSIWINPKG
jgi:hypothetical protein